MTKIRSYSELRRFDTFDERYKYLKLDGVTGTATFGFDRYINQRFYRSYEWRKTRELVVIRDNGCDLGIPGFEIHTALLIHHMNPLTENDIVLREDWIFDPEYLICTTKKTHNAIHFGDDRVIYPEIVADRTPNDTKLW